MDELLDALRSGAPWVMPLVAAALVTLVLTIAFLRARTQQRRVRGFLWLLGPGAVYLAGLNGVLSDRFTTLKALGATAVEHKANMGASGLAMATVPDQLAVIVCAIALGLMAVGLTVMNHREGSALPLSLRRPATALTIGVLGAVAIVLISGNTAPRVGPVMATALLAVSLCAAVTTSRTLTDATGHLADEAGFIVTAGTLALAALSHLLVNLDTALMYRAMAHSDPELHDAFKAGGTDAILSTALVGLVAVFFGSMLLPLAVARRGGSRNWRRGFAVLGVIGAVLFLRLFVGNVFADVMNVGG